MAKFTGYIPESVTYISQGPHVLSSYWEDDALHAGWVGQTVIPTFPSDSLNTEKLESGRSWAKGYWNKSKIVTEKTFKNDPITDVTVLSLEVRSKGGRAYKVVCQGNYYFDVREDVLLDTMLDQGIAPGGVLKGEFIWAVHGTQMKLIRIGSKLHTALVNNTEVRKGKKIGRNDLIVGNMYCGKSKENFLFLGYVDTIRLEYHDAQYGYSREVKPEIANRTDIKNGLLLYSISSWQMKTPRVVEAWTDHPYYNYVIKNSHSFLEDLGPVKHDAISIPHMKKANYKRGFVPYKEFNNSVTIPGLYMQAHVAEFILAVPTGTPIEIPEYYADIIPKFKCV